MCNSRKDKTQTESMCPTIRVAPTEASDVLQNHKSDDGITASTSGGSNGSNSEIRVEDRKRILEKKQPSWMSSSEFFCLVTDIQGGYCVSPVSKNGTIQSNEQKQWLKAMNEELASLKENETCELVNRPVNAKGIQNRWVMRVKMSCDGNARCKTRLVVKGCAQNKELFMM